MLAKTVKLMLLPLKKGAQFDGRARRAEFWLFSILVVVVWQVFALTFEFLIFIIFDVFNVVVVYNVSGGADLGTHVSAADVLIQTALFLALICVFLLVGWGTLIPLIGVAVRRLHDRNIPGWFLPVPFAAFVVPFLVPAHMLPSGTTLGEFLLLFASPGVLLFLAVLVCLCLKGTDGPNRFGDDPLQGAAG